jgi:hypothetical protein
MGVGNKMRMS